jgi:hypothetical protein
LITSNEAHFHLSGYVNKQNFRHWAEENLRLLHKSPLHSQKATVWCGLSSFGVLGPHFFENNRHAVMVTAERCGHAQRISCAKTTLKPQWYTLSMVSTRWCDISHGTNLHANSSRNVPSMCHLEKWWCHLASTPARFIPMWLLLKGISKAQGL